jgi:hypothetical protein
MKKLLRQFYLKLKRVVLNFPTSMNHNDLSTKFVLKSFIIDSHYKDTGLFMNKFQ